MTFIFCNNDASRLRKKTNLKFMNQKMNSEELIGEYLRKLAIMGRSPRTARTYRIEIRKMFRYFDGHETIKTLSHIDRSAIERYQLFLKQGERPVSEISYYNNVLAVRLFFRWLEDEDRIPYLSKYVQVPSKPEKKVQEFFSEKEMQKVLDIVETESKLGARDKAILELLYNIGGRSGEIGGITMGDVKFRERVVVVRRSKGKKYDGLPVSKIALKYLKHYADKKRHLFLNSDKSLWFFLNLRGTPMEGR